MKKVLISLTLVLSSSFVCAQDLNYTLCEVGVEGDNDVFILPCERHTSQNSCGDSWLHWDLETQVDTEQLNNARTALVTGNEVVIRTNGCSGGRDNVTMVRIKR